MKNPSISRVILAALLTALLLCLMAGCGGIREVPAEEAYSYVNPDEAKAQTDEGIVIDGVLDEAVYQDNNWLYLHNDDGGNNVDIAMTSHYGEKGMYFVFDVTETVPIYVNLQRASYMNSCIEMYFAPASVTSLKENSYFEVDMLPTGDMVFKKSNGKGGYVNVATTDDIMAHLGATTKGGEINTEDCYGYCLELFIPWDYMSWLGLDAQAMQSGFVYVDPAHITSHNLTGTDTSVDRYWYFYAQQQGAGFSDVYQYFRFNGSGVMGTVPITLEAGAHCSLSGDGSGIPGMETTVTIKAEEGYALSSVLINGEEALQSLSFGSDGTVELTTRIPAEGLTVAATAEAVTEGNKTLSGKVSVLKPDGGSLEGVLVTYVGPTGEKPVELQSDGSFILTDLQQGHYTLKAEKDGFTAVSRGIYLNRDSYAELSLEYDTFYAERGTCWVLDEQNRGILKKFGGTGYLLSTDSYDRFTFEANFRYDQELAKEAETDFFSQQRSGMRILFSNGKYWHIDLLKENDNYIVQYAKHSGDNSVFSWKNICTMNEEQIAAYCSQEGIRLRVVRNGQYAGVFLGDSLIALEKLDDELASCTAQLGFEYWVANRTVVEIPYAISTGNTVDVANASFLTAKGWDVSGQFDGYVVLTEGGRGDLTFTKKYADMDLTLTVRDHDDPDRTAARNDVLLVFDNGAHVSFGITSDANGAWIQALNKSADDGKQILRRFAHLGALTEEEFALYKSEGVDFRIVRSGTEASLYIGERLVRVVDLTGNESGVTGDMLSTVTIRHYDDAGVAVKLPFKMTGTLNQVVVDCVETEFGKVAANKQSYVMGDTVILSDSGEGDYYCTGIKVDGKAVELDADGTYSFVAEKASYTVEGTFAPRLFADSKLWRELKQCDGILTVPACSGDSGWIDSYKTYQDIDLTLTLRDQKNADGNFRGAVRLTFENEQQITFSLTNAKAADDDPAVYDLQNMGDSFYGWKSLYTLSGEQAEKLQNEGIDLRIVRIGAIVDVYVDGVHAYEYDLTNTKDGQPSEVADKEARVSLRLYGNTEKDVQAGFALSGSVEKVTLDIKSGENGSVAAGQKTYILGDTVELRSDDTSAYYCTGIRLDGKAVELDALGGYCFLAEKNSYSVEGSFAPRLFKDGSEWNGAKQNEGILSIPQSDGDSGWLESYNSYNDLDLRLILRDQDTGSGSYRAAVRLSFANGEYVTFSLTNAREEGDDPAVYELQNMGGTLHNWALVKGYSLSAQQVEKLQSESGIELRVVRIGQYADLYVDGEHICEFDLSVNRDGSPSGVAEQSAAVQLRYYGNTGKDVTVPVSLKDKVETVTLDIASSEKGSVAADQNTYIKGDTVVLSSSDEGGYYCAGFTVDGKAVALDALGGCSFLAEKDSYSIAGSYAQRIFKSSAEWNGAKQNEGLLTVSGSDGDSGWIESFASYGELDFTVRLQDLHNAEDNYRAAVRLSFENGQYVTFSLTNDHSNDDATTVYALQNMGDGFYGWKIRYTLTEEQAAKLQGEGIDLRIVRVNEIVDIYLDGVHAYEYALTADKDGNPVNVAEEAATVSLRLYGNVGEDVTLPFALADAVDAVTVQIENSAVTASQKNYLMGETVQLRTDSDKAYYCTQLQVDGSTVQMDADGGYSFIAEKASYTVNGSFAAKAFRESAEWDGTKQNEGLLTVPGSDGDSGWIESFASYGELDFTVKLQDLRNAEDNYRAAVRLSFENGQYVTFSLTNDHSNEDDTTVYALQNMGDAFYGWKISYTLTGEQAAKLQGEGIDLRIVRVNEIVDIYLDGVHACEYDLTADRDGNPANVAEEAATVSLRLYGNAGEDVTLPFALTDTVDTVTVQIAEDEKNSIATAQKNYLLGETVEVFNDDTSPYYFTALRVDGQAVELNALGGYSFVAEKASYQLSGSFADKIFNSGMEWNTRRQNEGILTVPGSDGDSGWLVSYDRYHDLDLTLTVRDLHNADDNFRAAIRLSFENGQVFSVSLTNDHSNNDATTVYALQNMGDSFYNWKSMYTLTESQASQVCGQGVKVRIVRTGAEVNLYIDGVHVYEYDLTNDKNGEPSEAAGQSVDISLRLYGNVGEDVQVPFAITEDVQKAHISVTDGGVRIANSTVFVGDTVTLLPADDGCRFVSLTVDGEPVTLAEDGTYSFTASAEHTVSAVSERILDWNSKDAAAQTWDLTEQNSGILKSPASTADTDWTQTYEDSYRDIILNVSDRKPGDNSFRMAVQFSFQNGQVFRISLTNADSGELGVYKIQTMSANTVTGNWKTLYRLSAEESELLKSGDGLRLRIAIVGTNANVYLNYGKVCTVDLSKQTDGTDSGIGTHSARIGVRMYGNSGEDAAVSYRLGGEPQTVTVSIANAAEGTITLNSADCILGEKVTVTVVGNPGYAADTLTVNGQTVNESSYTFTALAENTISATFRTIVFGNSSEWDNSQQESGILKIPASDGDSGWIETNRKDYQNVDFRLQLHDHANADDNFRTAIRLYFSNDQYVSFTLTNDRSNDDETTVYELQTMGGTILNWKYLATLTADQVAKLTGSEGLEFRVVRLDTMLYVYVGGTRIYEYDMTGAVSTETCSVVVRCYGNSGKDVELPFSLSEDVAYAGMSIDAGENGTVTADLSNPLVGDTVVLTVAGNAGYAHDSLTVNGSAAATDLYGVYSFTAQAENTVSATFAASLFKDTVTGWLLENQHYGKIAVSYTNANGNSNWLDFAKQYTDVDITLQAREYADTVKPITRSAIRFTFENGKVITFSIAKNTVSGGYKYSVQSLSGDSIVGTNHDFYVMNEAQADSFRSEAGIQFRVVRSGTKVFVELDGVLVVDGFDLTTGNSGVTAAMPMNVTVRRYDDPGIRAEYGIRVSETLTLAQITVDPAITGGTVTADKTEAVYGDQVTLTVTPADGNACQALKINGQTVLLDWDGSYAFSVTESAYTVEAAFAQVAFTKNSSNSWNLTNQLQGLLRVDSHASGNSGWIDSALNTNDVTTVVTDHTPDSKNFSMIYHFTFSNGETFRLRLNHTDSDGVYRIQSMSSSSLFAAWKSRYDFSAEETAKIKGEGIAFRVILLDSTAYVYLDDVQVCTYDLTSTGKGSGLSDCTVKVALRMDGNLNTDVPVSYILRETTELP